MGNPSIGVRGGIRVAGLASTETVAPIGTSMVDRRATSSRISGNSPGSLEMNRVLGASGDRQSYYVDPQGANNTHCQTLQLSLISSKYPR